MCWVASIRRESEKKPSQKPGFRYISFSETQQAQEEPGLLDPGPFPFVLCAATERTCGPGGRRLPTERPRPARTATPRCYRPTAAVPSSPPSEREPGLEREPGWEPGQPSAAGAQARERPWAARAHPGRWPQ